MIRITDKSQCCGCTACYAVCPYDAIQMHPDALGFKYPYVDIEKCVDCRLCEKVCDFQSAHGRLELTPDTYAYAVRHQKLSEVEASASGAVFAALSDMILQQKGVIYGAAFNKDFAVSHDRAETREARDRFRRSKYVQSDMGDIFSRVRQDLQEGRIVLFSGTPCQCAGLKRYIGGALCNRLYLIDLVCHGVPGPEVWKQYLEWQQRQAGSKVISVKFRDKTFGWRAHKESYDFPTGKAVSSSYTYLFYKHLTLRESCGVCPYSSLRRSSDITIADYWTKDKSVPDFASDDKGCSLVLCNSDKGRQLFEASKDHLSVQRTDIEDCLQPNLTAPSELPRQRCSFEKDFSAKGIEYVMKRYGDRGWRYKVYKYAVNLYQMIRQSLRKLLGRV